MRASGFGCVLRMPSGLSKAERTALPRRALDAREVVEQVDAAVLRPLVLRPARAPRVERVVRAGGIGRRLRDLIEERDHGREIRPSFVGSGPEPPWPFAQPVCPR